MRAYLKAAVAASLVTVTAPAMAADIVEFKYTGTALYGVPISPFSGIISYDRDAAPKSTCGSLAGGVCYYNFSARDQVGISYSPSFGGVVDSLLPYVVFQFSDATSGNILNLNFQFSVTGDRQKLPTLADFENAEKLQFYFSGSGGTGGTVEIAAVTTAVPESATWAMMLIGFGAIGATMRRRQRASVQFA